MLYKSLSVLYIAFVSIVYATEPRVQEHFIQVEPGIELRVVRLDPGSSPGNARPADATNASAPKKVILYLPGRSSFFEKNLDFMQILSGEKRYLNHARTALNDIPKNAYEVWVIDHRGHGKSGGRLGEPCKQRCHITSFEHYLTDIHTVVTQLIMPAYPSRQTQIILMGDSMGGHLALRYAERYPEHLQHLILIAPMLQFKTSPWPTWMAKFIVRAACLLGRAEQYAVGYGPLDLTKSDFSKFKGHHNEQAFHQTNKLLEENPHLITAGPTYGWVQAAFESCELSLGLDELRKLTCPVTIYVAGEDQVVDNSALTIVTSVHGKTEVMTIPGAWHNLVKEKDDYSLPFLTHLTKLLTNM